MGGQGGCERRIICFCENSKKNWGGSGRGVGWGLRVEKKWLGVGLGRPGWGVRVDV